MVSAPGSNDMERFIKSMEFVVVPEAFMTETAKLADVVLPVAMFMERADLFYTYGHNYLQYRQKIVEPPEGCRTEPDIFRELAARFGFDEKYFPKNDVEILRACLAASPYGLTLEDLEAAPAKLTSYRDIAWGDLKFNTPSGKIELLSEGLAARWGCDPLPKIRPAAHSQGEFSAHHAPCHKPHQLPVCAEFLA
jgi:anaerobic selenocysteine-containing dehydrogenase